jgi:hypothetical protein
MNLSFNDFNLNIQIVPIYGMSLGVIYYDPNLEPDMEDVEPEEFYSQITMMFLFFGLHLTFWRG